MCGCVTSDLQHESFAIKSLYVSRNQFVRLRLCLWCCASITEIASVAVIFNASLTWVHNLLTNLACSVRWKPSLHDCISQDCILRCDTNAAPILSIAGRCFTPSSPTPRTYSPHQLTVCYVCVYFKITHKCELIYGCFRGQTILSVFSYRLHRHSCLSDISTDDVST